MKQLNSETFIDKGNLPSNWSLNKLVEVAKVESGYGFPIKYQGKHEGQLPFFKVGDISKTLLQGTKYLTKANNYVSYEICKKIKAKPLEKGTIVFARIGEAIRLNRRAIVCQDSLIDNNVAGVFSYLHNLYLFYYLLTIKLGDYSRATTVPSIRKTDIEEIIVPIPPLNEQERIVSKLEELFTKLDAGIDYLKKTKILLKQYRQSVLKYAFEGKLTEKWHKVHKNDIEHASLLIKGINNEIIRTQKQKFGDIIEVNKKRLPEIPETWIWTTMSVLVLDARYGTSKKCSYEKSGIPIIRIPNIANGEISTEDLKYTELTEEEKQSLSLEPGDILVIRTNGSLNLVGRSAVIKNLGTGFGFASYLIRLRPVISTIGHYVNLYLDSKIPRDHIERKARTTAGQYNVNLNTLGSLLIPLPSIPEQSKIIEETERKFSIIEKNESIISRNLTYSEKLRQGILKNAFEGNLVPQDPKDEPAEMLLQRIQQEKSNIENNSKRTKNKSDPRQMRLV